MLNVFIPSFFSLQSKPNARRRTSPCHAMHCRRGGRVTMHSPGQTATKARGQNTGHDRVARCHTCYLDDRVHAEQRQRARSSLCLLRRHRWCHCRRDIPGIWRFGLLRRGAQTHEKRLDSNKLPLPQRDGRCSFVEQIIRRRRRHRREIFALSSLRDHHRSERSAHCTAHARHQGLLARCLFKATSNLARSMRIITLWVAKRHKS